METVPKDEVEKLMQVFSFVVSIVGITAALAILAAVVFWISITSNGQNPFR